jgi:proliferating cell nuclear antigen
MEEFKIVVKASILKKIMNALKELVSEAKFTIDEDGLQTTMATEDHVSLINVKLMPKLCELFKAKKTEFAIDILDMNELLKLAEGEDRVTLSKNDENMMKVEFGIIRRRIPFVDMEEKGKVNIPNLNFTTNADMKAELLNTALKGAAQLDKTIKFMAKPSALIIQSQNHSNEFEGTLEKDTHMSYYDTNGTDFAYYTLDYLNSAMKTSGASDKISFSFAKDEPVQLQYGFEEDALSFTYMIAPCIIDEDL